MRYKLEYYLSEKLGVSPDDIGDLLTDFEQDCDAFITIEHYKWST